MSKIAERIAMEAYPPKMRKNPKNPDLMDDYNANKREELIAAIEGMEARGIEISIREGGRDNSLSKEILEEAKKSVGELEETCKSEVCAYRGKGVCKFKIGEYCPMYSN